MKLTRTIGAILATCLATCLTLMAPMTADAARHAPAAPAPRSPPPDTPADPSSPAVQALQRLPLGPQAAAAFHWAQAWQGLNLAGPAGNLRNFLLQAWLTELETGSARPPTDVGAATLAGTDWPDDRLARAGADRWQAVAERFLRPSVESARVPLPDEIDNLHQALTEEGPGLWAYRHADGGLRGLFMQVTLTNIATQPLPTGEFDLDLVGRSGVRNERWACLLPRGAVVTALASGAARTYLCRFHKPPTLAAGQSLAGLLDDARQPGALRLHVHDFDTATRRQALADALAAGHRAELDEFLRQNASCERRRNCRPAPAAPLPARDERPPPERNWHEIGRVIGWVAGVVFAIWLLNRLGGPVLSVGVAFAVSTFYGWRFAHDILTRNWADSWGGLVALPAALIGAILPFIVATIVSAGVARSRRKTD